MTEPELTKEELDQLIELLETRLAVIGDSELRENDPASQLAQLQEVSESIMAFRQAKRKRISPRLNHFLGNSSLEKALDWAKGARSNL